MMSVMENQNEDMKALVFGYGRSGKAAEASLCRAGFSVTALDGEAAFPDGTFDVAVVSPGIALAHPWIAEAKRRGIPLKSELQLGCEELKRQGWKLLAVTGSKGKSSVVKVVADAIGFSGRQAVACGNYGLPVCEVAGSRDEKRGTGDERWAVVEVSSFMMETTGLPADTFEAAVILNLQEDHLDRHGSVEVYHGLKRKLLTMAKRGVEGGAPDGTDVPWAGSYFDNEILCGNAACAAELMRVAGLDDATISQAFREFVPLPHRMNLVAEIDGVRYIDDSKATSLAALVAGVKMAASLPSSTLIPHPSIHLIAGGLPKGDDPKIALSTLTKRVKKVYLIGQSAEVFRAAWKSAVDCEICGTMDVAVRSAKRGAVKGDAVLLSPGTASFDQFESFGERGEVFARLVQKGK